MEALHHEAQRKGCLQDDEKESRSNRQTNADDVDSYHASGDFRHGFHSGCLGAFRLVQKAMDEDDYILDDDDETKLPLTAKQRLEWALEEFPQLDT